MNMPIEEYLIGKIYYDGNYYCYIYGYSRGIYDNCIYMKEHVSRIYTENNDYIGVPNYTPEIQTIIQLISKINHDLNTSLFNELLEFYPEYLI